MEYEIVNLEEKIAVGLSARTSNASPDMGAVIGGLWNQFYNGGVYASIQGKANQKALGIYTEYEGDEKAQYTVLVACEVAEGRETGEWFRLWAQLGRKYGAWICQGHSSVILRNTRTILWKMRKFTFMLG